MKTLYLECASGVSGDMLVAALLDLGADPAKLSAALSPLRHEGLDWTISRRESYGVEGCDFSVALSEPCCGEHAHAHGHGPHDAHEHGEHAHEHEHHEHCGHDEYEHAHHHHEHGHRNLHAVEHVIDHADLGARAKAVAKKAFRIIAEAEAKAHGKPLGEVHFHEIGALDSIADIVGAAALADDLDVGACVVTGVSEGVGFVRCAHGELPVPVPATLNIAAAHAIPLRIRPEVSGEMCTPTGIALAAALRTASALPACFTVEKTGVGLGKKDFGRPNILRAMLITENAPDAPPPDGAARMFMLETNIDDCTGERLGLALGAVMEAGAADAHFIPCFMKKNRPAYLLRVLAAEPALRGVEDALFRHTTTIGVRRHEVARTVLERRSISVALPFGEVSVKICRWDGGAFCYPEYESVRAASAASGLPFDDVFSAARAAASSAL